MRTRDATKSPGVTLSYVPKPLDLIAGNNIKSFSSSQVKFSNHKQDNDTIQDNYVARFLANEPARPPITWSNWYYEVDWPKLIVLGSEPLIGLYGIYTTVIMWQTIAFSLFWGLLTGLSITAGYHRLFAHRSYEATLPLRYVLVALGAGAVQGSAYWWVRGHRAHHRYTDTDLDPYSAHKGIFHSHIGWLLFKPRRNLGAIKMADLTQDKSVQWQRRNLLTLNIFMGFLLPILVCGMGWDDYRGGYFYASVIRIFIVHHITFCVNSLAHYFGDTPFDDKHTPRDHFITAIITLGEGYHNFHHEFPSDYRNAIRWFQYDPTKWTIWIFEKLGLASNLKKFPENEIQKGRYGVMRKQLDKLGETIEWPKDTTQLPIITFDEYQYLAKNTIDRELILIAGFVYDVSNFIEAHPGGRILIKNYVGKDATVAFHGGVKDHSIAAHNMLGMMRVAVCSQGGEVEHQDKQMRHVSVAPTIH